MADEMSQEEKLSQSLPGDHDLSGDQGSAENPVSEDRANGLENLVTAKDGELVKTKDRITELEEVISERDGQITALKQVETEFEERLDDIAGSLTEALTAYRDMVIQANPEILEEMVEGNSLQAINESLGKAKSLTSRVREGVEAQIWLTRVPSGAPERTSPDFSALSSREKIKYAMEKVR